MKRIGKGHSHKATQANVKLRKVVEVAKTFEATTFANQLMKKARNTQQEHVNYTTKSPQLLQCFWCGGKHQQPPQQHCPAMGKNCAKCGITDHFARVCRGGTRRHTRQQQSNFVSEDTNEEAFVKKIFCESALDTWRENKSRKGVDRLCIHLQYHSLKCAEKLFPNAEIRQTRS